MSPANAHIQKLNACVSQDSFDLLHTVLKNLHHALLQVDVEDTSGGWAANIFGIELSNTFRNLTNIILYIEPKGMSDKKALLVNAHYDSAIGSPGDFT